MLARLLGARDMGLYTLALSVASIGSMVAGLGFGNPTIRLTAKYRASQNLEEIRGLLTIISICVLSLGLIIFFFIILGAGFISRNIFHKPELYAPLILISGSVVTFSFLNVFNNALRGIGQGDRAVFLENILIPLCGISIFLLLFYFGNKVKGAAIAYLFSTTAGLIFSLFLVTKSIKMHISRRFPPLREIMRDSTEFFVLNIINNLQTWIGIYIVGILMASEDVAILKVASSIAILVSLPLQSVNDILPLAIVKYHASSQISRLQSVLSDNSRWIMAISLPIFVVIILFPQYILSLLGKDFTTGGHALIILSLGYLFDSFMGSVSLILRMTDNQKYIIRAGAIVFVVSIGLYYYFTKTYGVIGTAFVSTTVIIVMNVWNTINVQKLFKIRAYTLNLKDLLSAIALSTAMMLLIKAVGGSVILCLLTFSIFYLLMTRKIIFRIII